MTRLSALLEDGFLVMRGQFARTAVKSCRDAFWPVLTSYLERYGDAPNRGPYRHFLPMPFEPPCFAPEFFFDATILDIVHSAMDERVVADQWGCDVPLRGSEYQGVHADYQRPLFAEQPDLVLPPYMLVVSFGLVPITSENGPLEVAAGTHRLPRSEAMRAVNAGEIALTPILLDIGDVLIRHPWVLHRGTPNTTDVPRPLVTIRYVRRWYADTSRDVNTIPLSVWESLTAAQQSMLRFEVS